MLRKLDQNKPEVCSMRPLRAGIVGAGYIAEFHAQGIRRVNGVELTSVCDHSLTRAKTFGANWGVSQVFGSLESMLHDGQLDAIHVLTPPDLHHSMAKAALQAGIHVLLEKPMCISAAECDELLALTHDGALCLAVNHNLLYSAAYLRLRDAIRSHTLGPLDHIAFNYFVELGQLHTGPFDSWMFRSSENVFLEIGPHLVSALLDLVGVPDRISAIASFPIKLPGGRWVFRRWRVHATVGATDIEINLDVGRGFAHRTISVRGLIGFATADLESNTCTIDRAGSLSVDLDRYSRNRCVARQLQLQSRKTLMDYALSKIKLRDRGNPYQVTILDSVAAFYNGIRSTADLDNRIAAHRGRQVVDICGEIIRSAKIETEAPVAPRILGPSHPTILVFGGTGFIGRELIRQLLNAGYCVRAAVRSSGSVLDELDNSGRLETVRVDLDCETELKTVMQGIDTVYHLARSNAKTWQDYLQRDVEPTRMIAEACLSAKVRRLIYTSTIDSYYAGVKAGTITEQTPLDENIRRRNYYARAKAASEAILLDMHVMKGLPVVIFRPGIVIGRGGNPFHWGLGMWPSPGVCLVWGDGKNELPFVLVTDVAAALIRGIETEGIEGRSYNVVDTPLLTARDYLAELQRIFGMTVDVRYKSFFKLYLADLGKWVLKVAIRHHDRSRIPSYSDWETRTQRANFDCRSIREDLKWQPASDRQRMIEEGIRDSIRSFLES
jgi:predicted dehydrogenase/nucleoside-diphosphate-sugar epimerase